MARSFVLLSLNRKYFSKFIDKPTDQVVFCRLPEEQQNMEDGIPIAERLAQLREENAQLREAARVFGELAERLMEQLDAERRHRQSPVESSHAQPGRGRHPHAAMT
jgi:hypothetical protein